MILCFTNYYSISYSHNVLLIMYFHILDKINQRVMQIFVRTLDDRTLTLNVQSEDTISEIKEIVEQREGK